MFFKNLQVYRVLPDWTMTADELEQQLARRPFTPPGAQDFESRGWVSPADDGALRKKLNLNQSEFWSPLGVTQSGGSRYESCRKIAKPVQMLLRIAYGTNMQAQAMIDALRKRGDEE